MFDLLKCPHDEATRRAGREVVLDAARIDTDGRYVPPGASATMRVDAWRRGVDLLEVLSSSLGDARVARLAERLDQQIAEIEPLARAEQLAAWVEARVGPESATAAQGFLASERKSNKKRVKKAIARGTKACVRLGEALAVHQTNLAAPRTATFGQALAGHLRALGADAVANVEERNYPGAAEALRRVTLLAELGGKVPAARALAVTAARASRMTHSPFDPQLARKVLLAAGLTLSDEVVDALSDALAPNMTRGVRLRLLEQVETAALALEGQTHHETERKYLLSGLPEVTRDAPMKRLAQGYVPGRVLQERLRRIEQHEEVRFVRTVKLGRGVTRVEIEEETSEEVFSVMWPLTRGCRVVKDRYAITEGALTWVIDDFSDRDLVLAEVELPAEGFSPPIPSWLAPHLVRDVTDDSQFVNINLAR